MKTGGHSFIVLVALIISGCGFYGWSAYGRVMLWDKQSIKKVDNMLPASDTFIKVTWCGSVPRPADGAVYCYKAKIIKTDDLGNYDSGSVWMLPKLYPVINMSASVTVYKPGYQEDLRSSFRGINILVKSDEESENRLYRLYLYSGVDGCSEIVKDKNLKDFLTTILDEASSLPIIDIENEYEYKQIKILKDRLNLEIVDVASLNN